VNFVIYDGTPDIKAYCVSLLESKHKDFAAFSHCFSEEELGKFEETHLAQIQEVNEGKYCPLSGMDRMVVGTERNTTLFFRDLHRWGGRVEISGVSYTSA